MHITLISHFEQHTDWLDQLRHALDQQTLRDGELVVWDLQNGPAFEEPFTPTSSSLRGLGWTQMDWVSYEATLDARLRTEGVIE